VASGNILGIEVEPLTGIYTALLKRCTLLIILHARKRERDRERERERDRERERERESTEEAINNRHSRETGNIRYTRRRRT
jgi:hypothetical protein